MPSINLKKELYDTLIRKGITVTPFVSEAVYFKIRNMEQNKQAVNISQELFDYLKAHNMPPEPFVNQVVKEKLDKLEKNKVNKNE